MELRDTQAQHRPLAITPIAGWRRWLVTSHRIYESGVGPVLRGLHGVPWERSTLTAACDEGSNPWFNALRGGGHAEDAPEPACRCGIYAWKHGVAGTVPPRRPHAVGSVHLSGTVIEGTTGYRARWATIDGPLELFLPCGSARSASPCDSAPVVVRLSGADFVGACARHDEGGGWRMAAAEWRAAALVALGDRYLTPIM